MKHRFAIHTHTLVRLLAALPVLLLLVASCVNDYDNCPAPQRDADPVKLSFTIVTRTSMETTRQTRAADTNADGDIPGTAPENYLNLAGGDIRFLLFDEEQKLLREFTPDADITVVEGNTNYVSYTVRATIAEPYFAQVAERVLSFYIMVIANGNSHKLNAFALAPNVTTIKDIADQCTAFTLPVGTPSAGPSTANTGWTPSQPGQADGEYIPMAGLQQFTLPKGAFDGNGAEGFVELSPEGSGKDINMLRALAKIEVIDRIDITGNVADAPEGRPSVQKVELLGYCATGTILPAYVQWNRNDVLETQQVVAPTMAASLAYRAPADDYTATVANSQIDFHSDAAATDGRADGCQVFSVYTTEYSQAAIPGTAVRPYVRITLSLPNEDGTATTTKLYQLKLAEYNGGTAGANIAALLRNHIYRYEITAVRNELEIKYTLCPMGEEEVDIPPFN